MSMDPYDYTPAVTPSRPTRPTTRNIRNARMFHIVAQAVEFQSAV